MGELGFGLDEGMFFVEINGSLFVIDFYKNVLRFGPVEPFDEEGIGFEEKLFEVGFVGWILFGLTEVRELGEEWIAWLIEEGVGFRFWFLCAHLYEVFLLYTWCLYFN